MEKKERYFTKSKLYNRGWTKSIIEKMEIVADKQTKNPYYRSAPPVQLFIRSKIRKLEKSQKFLDLLEISKKYKKAAIKQVATKKDKNIKEVLGWKIKVPKIKNVKKLAIAHYECLRYDNYVEPNPSKEFLHRITVNFLRHEMTEYERNLDRLFGKVGKQRAYLILTRKVLNAIAKEYPWLKEECRRQLRYKQGKGEVDRSLEYYMSLEYEIEVKKIPKTLGSGYTARLIDFEYRIVADGATKKEALQNLEVFKKETFEEWIKEERRIPLPKKKILKS